jgi:hypothetical protein
MIHGTEVAIGTVRYWVLQLTTAEKRYLENNSEPYRKLVHTIRDFYKADNTKEGDADEQ